MNPPGKVKELQKSIKYYNQHPDKFVRKFLKAEPTVQQDDVLKVLNKSIEEGLSIVVKSGHGCFGKGTKVRMFDGSIKNVEDVIVGDQVMGDDGKSPRNVLEIYQGQEELYKFKTRYGEYIFNKSHGLPLVSMNNKYGKKYCEKYIDSVYNYLEYSKDRKRVNGFYKKGITYSKKELKIDPYTLGVWLGDGTSSRAEVSNIDKEIIQEWYKDAKNRNLEITKRDNLTYAMSTGTKNHNIKNTLMDDLRYYNLIKNKHIPFEYKTSSIQQRLELLAGLIDTDGSLDQRNKRVYEITQKNKTLSYDIQELCWGLGIHASLNKVIKYCYYKGEKKYGEYYRICITRNIEKIPCRITRKKAINSANIRQCKNNLHYTIKSIEPLGVGTYYGFELDGNHLFQLSDGLVQKNTGKTCMMAWIIIWFMFTRPFPKIVCTAPTARQLYDVLWAELSKWYQDNPTFVGMFDWTSTRFANKQYPKNWFASARTSNKPEAMAGIHAKHVLYLIDEASGVDDKVFEVIEGGQTETGSLQIMFSNPTQISGAFHDAFGIKRKFFKCFTFSCLKSPRVRPEYGEKIAAKYGVDSDVYRVRVLGEFPKAEPDSVMSLALVEKAIVTESIQDDEEIDFVEMGADIARFGDDASTIWSRIGKRVIFEEEIRKQDIMTVANKIAFIRNNKWASKRVQINVDVVGIGAGVVDRLNEKFKDGELKGEKTWPEGIKDTIVKGINNGMKARKSRMYGNIVTEMWFNFKSFLEEGAQLPDNVDLIGELTTRKYVIDSKNRQIIERKDMVKKRLNGKSPDHADGAILTTHTLEYDEDGIRALSLKSSIPVNKEEQKKVEDKERKRLAEDVMARIDYYKKARRGR